MPTLGRQRSSTPLNGYGLDVLHPSPPNNDSAETQVDIVFVHGLGGTSQSTWSKEGVFWPRDLLKEEFPRARIMTWGYDSHIMKFFTPGSEGNIQDHAKTLNQDLINERNERYQAGRPIIFFAHSLGGLVVKNALFLSYLQGVKETPSNSNNIRIATIKWCTRGILFAGTPHHGSVKANWAATAKSLAWFVHKDQSSHLVNALKQGSDTLDTLQENFKNILESFAVYTLLEEVPYPSIGKIVEKDSARIGWHEVEISIHANHRDMVKFAHPHDPNYKRIKGAFKDIVRDKIETSEQGQNNWARMANWNRSAFLGPLDTSFPGGETSRQNLLTFDQQEPYGFGRVQTLAPEEPAHWIGARRSSERLMLSPESYGGSVERNRGSPTTFGNVGSGSNRSSQSSSRQLWETQKPLPTSDAHFLQLMEQGKQLAQKTDQNFAKNLAIAGQYFTKAQNSLSPSSDPAAFVLVLYQLMHVEFQKAFQKGMTPEEKISHLQRAEQYGWDAAGYARQSSTAGDSAQVKLYMAIIRGRKAEIHARLGVSPQEIRNQKDEALSGIFIAMEELQQADRGSENIEWSKTWTERLQIAPNSRELHSTSIPTLPELGPS